MVYFRNRLLAVSCLLCSLSALVGARLPGVPGVPFQISTGEFSLKDATSIAVNAAFKDSVNEDGETLIPPTLSQFAKTFQEDLKSSCGIDLAVTYVTQKPSKAIYLTIGTNGGFVDAVGRPTSEGYSLEVSSDGVTITGASALGAWWGTRTVIQQAALGKNMLKAGKGVDAPGWRNRGFSLDVARHYFPAEFLIEMCSYLSFHKQNAFQIHLSDNHFTYGLTPDQISNVYAAFRLDSPDAAVAGLNKRKNESYTQEVWENIQEKCAQRGVTLIPELETPGHALVITQWKPEIALDSDPTMLNIAHPETIPTIKAVWKTFLPWLKCKTVHIGADEYISGFVDDYNRFVNEISGYITQISGKKVRIWSTFPPVEGELTVNKNVSIQHWAFFEANPYKQWVLNGYEVINSDDGFYVVGGYSGSYPQVLNFDRIFTGNPATGGPFSPNIFDSKDPSNNPPRSEPKVLGHLAAVWNDFGNAASTVIDAYYSLRNGLPALADKQWGGNQTRDEYNSIFNVLHAAVPDQNLDRSIKSISPDGTIFNYTMQGGATDVQDLSGNGYHARLTGDVLKSSSSYLFSGGSGFIETPLSSKGRDYTLSFSVKPTTRGGTLFAGADSQLVNGVDQIGYVTLIENGVPFQVEYALPLNTWTTISLVAQGSSTYLRVDGVKGSTLIEFLGRFPIPGGSETSHIGVNAPLATIGKGFKGEIKDMFLLGRAVLDAPPLPPPTSTTTSTTFTTSSTSKSTITSCPTLSPLKCNADNCLRQQRDARYSSSASAFCSTYTTMNNLNPTAIPSFLGNCRGDPCRVSSACSCLMTMTKA